MAGKSEEKLPIQEVQSKDIQQKTINHHWRAQRLDDANQIMLEALNKALGGAYKVTKHDPFPQDKSEEKSEDKQKAPRQYIKLEKEIEKKKPGKNGEEAEVEKVQKHVLDFYRYGGGGEAIELQIRPVVNPRSQEEKDSDFVEAFEEFAHARFQVAKQQTTHNEVYLLKQVQPQRLHLKAIQSLLIDKDLIERRYAKVHFKGKEYWWDGELKSKPLDAPQSTASARLFEAKPQQPAQEHEGQCTSVEVCDPDEGSDSETSVEVSFSS